MPHQDNPGYILVDLASEREDDTPTIPTLRTRRKKSVSSAASGFGMFFFLKKYPHLKSIDKKKSTPHRRERWP